jgi:hypothetical protein
VLMEAGGKHQDGYLTGGMHHLLGHGQCHLDLPQGLHQEEDVLLLMRQGQELLPQFIAVLWLPAHQVMLHQPAQHEAAVRRLPGLLA